LATLLIRLGNNKEVTTAPRETYRDALSVALTVGAYGVAFGAAGIAAGFSVLQTCLFSLLTFTGASQFAAVGVMAAGGGVASAVAAATVLSTRNTLYGLQMAPLVKARGLKRIAAAHVTIDESTGVALAQTPRGVAAMRAGFWLTGIGVFLFWNIFTLVGAVGAKALGNPAAWGLDAAVPAAFLGLLWPRLTSGFLRIVAVVSMAFALIITPWLPAGLPIIASVLVAFVCGWRER
jgi:predicted branched-subunit amino acid permease